MNKKGQVTIFIIVGLILVVGVVLFFMFRENIFVDPVNPVETNAITTFVQECINSISEEGIYFISLQGGYYKTPAPKVDYLTIEIPVYFEVDKENIPSKETVGNELVKYIEDNLPVCVDNFKSFKQRGIEVTSEDISGTAEIKEEKILLEIDYSLTVKQGTSKSKIKNPFESQLNFDFNSKYSIVQKIVNNQKENPGFLPLGFITNLAYNEGFSYETISVDEKNTIISLAFIELNKPEQSFVYSFAVRYL